MFDADPFGALPEAAGEFSGELVMGFAAEEAQHVWAFEMRRGVLNQGGIDCGERLRVAEHQISGRFALIGRSVIALRPGLEDAPVRGIESGCPLVFAVMVRDVPVSSPQDLAAVNADQGAIAAAIQQGY